MSELETYRKALEDISRYCGYCPDHLGADDYKDPGVVMAKEIIEAMQETALKALSK